MSQADPPEAEPAPSPAPRSRRIRRRTRSRRHKFIVRGVLVLVVLWIIGAGIVGALGVLHASHGMSDIQDAKDHLSASDVVARSATAPLHKAQQQFDAASGWLHSPLLAPLDILPVLGRQLRSVQDLSSASAQIARIGVQAIGQAHGVLDSRRTPADRHALSELRQLASLASKTDAQLSRINTGPAHALLPPLSTKHDTFVNDLSTVRSRLQHAAGVAATTADILQGPQNYLLVMANNAEMRAGSGDFLEVGVLSTQDGHLQLSGVTPTVGIPVPAGKVIPTGDLEARWGWLKPGQDWRNLGFTPQFDVNGPLAAQMWQAETGQHVDGVIAVGRRGAAPVPGGDRARHLGRRHRRQRRQRRAAPGPRPVRGARGRAHRRRRPRPRRSARTASDRSPRPCSTPWRTSRST